MERLTTLAMISVGRACGFAGLGIVCIMLGLSYDPVLAAKTGAFLTTALAVILIVRAWQAPWRNYRHTELWIMLREHERPVANQAQKLTGNVLRDAYLLCAEYAARVALFFWATAIALYITLPDDFEMM